MTCNETKLTGETGDFVTKSDNVSLVNTKFVANLYVVDKGAMQRAGISEYDFTLHYYQRILVHGQRGYVSPWYYL